MRIPVRVIAALAFGLVSYTLVDILIWQRIFEAQHVNNDPGFIRLYHAGYAVVLAGLILNGVVLIGRSWWALWYAGAFFTLAMSGLEDALYYVLDGKAIPAALPWLDASPFVLFHPVTNTTLVASVAVWLAFWVATIACARYVAGRKVPHDKDDEAKRHEPEYGLSA